MDRRLRQAALLACWLGLWACAPGPQGDTDRPSVREPLAVYAVTPSVWSTLGGVPIEISGQGFGGGMQVRIDGQPASAVEVRSGSRLTASLPASRGRLGPVEVRVTAADGSEVARADLFAYSASEVALAGPAVLPLTGPAVALLTADLTREGAADLAVSVPSRDEVAVLVGDGRGGFTSMPSVAVPEPRSLASADLNGDGAPDLAVVCAASSAVCIRLGDGHGRFSAGTGVDLGAGLLKVVSADLNRDGRADLIALSSGPQSVIVLLGDGRAGFTVSATVRLASAPQGLAAADLDGDGALDLAVTRSEGIDTLLGDGRGGLAPPRLSAPSASAARALTTADFNEDGRPDVITWGAAWGFVRVQLGDGRGAFLNSAAIDPGTGPSSLTVVDQNGDGHLDVMVVLRSEGTLRLFLGDGRGGLTARAAFGVGAMPEDVATADFDRDGQIDVAVAMRSGVVVLRGDGANTLGLLSLMGGPAAVAAADFDGSGLLDLAVADASTNSCRIYQNLGAGLFARSATVITGITPQGVTTTDVDGNGKVDLVVSQGDSNNVWVYPGTGIGGFTSGFGRAVGLSPSALLVADFNRDAKPDVVVANQGSASVTVLLNKAGHLDLGTELTVGRQPSALAAGDLNGDGAMDLAVSSAERSSIFLLFGDGKGQFSEGRELPLGPQHYAVAVADAWANQASPPHSHRGLRRKEATAGNTDGYTTTRTLSGPTEETVTGHEVARRAAGYIAASTSWSFSSSRGSPQHAALLRAVLGSCALVAAADRGIPRILDVNTRLALRAPRVAGSNGARETLICSLPWSGTAWSGTSCCCPCCSDPLPPPRRRRSLLPAPSPRRRPRSWRRWTRPATRCSMTERAFKISRSG